MRSRALALRHLTPKRGKKADAPPLGVPRAPDITHAAVLPHHLVRAVVFGRALETHVLEAQLQGPRAHVQLRCRYTPCGSSGSGERCLFVQVDAATDRVTPALRAPRALLGPEPVHGARGDRYPEPKQRCHVPCRHCEAQHAVVGAPQILSCLISGQGSVQVPAAHRLHATSQQVRRG